MGHIHIKSYFRSIPSLEKNSIFSNMADVMEVKSDPIEVKATPATVGVSSDEPKQGKICCGFCCDFRRAVMVLAIIGIVLQAITLVLTLLGGAGLSFLAASVEDDAVQDELAGAD